MRRQRRRRAMDLGGAGPAVGPGQAALGQGGLEFLQHTGEGPGGASRAEGKAGGGVAAGLRGAPRTGPLRRGAGARPGLLPLLASRLGRLLPPQPALTYGLSPSQWAPCCPAMAGTSSWPLSPSISSSRRYPRAWRAGRAARREQLTQLWVSKALLALGNCTGWGSCLF